MDSLAPEDGSHRPAAEPTPPVHNLPPRGAWKPLIRVTKNLILWKTYAKAVKIMRWPLIRACASPTIKTHCVPVAVVQRCWKILFCARKSPTLTMSAFRNVLFMHADQPLTVISSHIKLKRYYQSGFPLRSEQNHPSICTFLYRSGWCWLCWYRAWYPWLCHQVLYRRGYFWPRWQ